MWRRESRSNMLLLSDNQCGEGEQKSPCNNFYDWTIESILTNCITYPFSTKLVLTLVKANSGSWFASSKTAWTKEVTVLYPAQERPWYRESSWEDQQNPYLLHTGTALHHLTSQSRQGNAFSKNTDNLHARSSQLKNSYFHQAIRRLNSLSSLPSLCFTHPQGTDFIYIWLMKWE